MNRCEHALEALALVELSSLARSAVVLDAMTKRAHIQLVLSEAVSPGKFLILYSGAAAEVAEAQSAAVATAGTALLDQLHLADAHVALLPLVRGTKNALPADTGVGVFEFASVGATLAALDAALKGTACSAHKLHLARGIGGKGYFVLAGELGDLQVAEGICQSSAGRLACDVVPRLSPDVSIEHL